MTHSIWTNKTRRGAKTSELEIACKPRIEGIYTIRRIHAETGDVIQELTFKNAITTLGLDLVGSSGQRPWNYCYVGTGTSVPSTSETIMPSFRAGTDTKQDVQRPKNVGEDGYAAEITTFRFGAGAASGNLTDVGVGWKTGVAPNNTDYLWSRQLILDGSGNPTTITVLSNEYLDVTYECRLYPDKATYTGSLSLTGGGTYAYSIRASSLNSGWGVGPGQSQRMGVITNGVFGSSDVGAVGTIPASYTAAVVTVSSGVFQQFSPNTNINPAAYVPGSFSSTSTSATITTVQGNFPSGLLGLRVEQNVSPSSFLPCIFSSFYLVSLDDKIPKTEDNTVNFRTSCSWAARILP